MFQDSPLSRQTKKMVYQAVMLGVLLYVAETWFAKQDIRILEGFHHCSLRNILGISRMQRYAQHINNEGVLKRFENIIDSDDHL